MAKPQAVVEKLLEIASCPVCFERLRPSATYCINGHPICVKCKGRLTKCPSCSGKFSEEKHIFLQQLLEALPFNCKYDGCTELTKDIDHHEKFCGYQRTICYRCKWSGPAKELLNHVEKAQHNYADNTTFNCHLINRDFSWTYVRREHDQIFWEIRKNDLKAKRFLITMVWVPDGKIDKEVFRLKVEFESDEMKYTATQKIQPGQEHGNGNQLVFHTDMLKPFTDKDSFVSYHMWILND